MIQLDEKSVSRFAHDVALRCPGGDWSAFVVRSDDEVGPVAEELASTIEQFADGARVRVVSDLGAADDVLEHARDFDVVVVAVTAWPELKWRELDLQRAKLPNDRVLVLVMSDEGLRRMTREAPNVYSLVQAPVRERPDEGLLTEPERQRRIALFEESTGLTSSEIIQRAAAGELPADPEYGEWLLLLDRGDLL